MFLLAVGAVALGAATFVSGKVQQENARDRIYAQRRNDEQAVEQQRATLQRDYNFQQTRIGEQASTAINARAGYYGRLGITQDSQFVASGNEITRLNQASANEQLDFLKSQRDRELQTAEANIAANAQSQLNSLPSDFSLLLNSVVTGVSFGLGAASLYGDFNKITSALDSGVNFSDMIGGKLLSRTATDLSTVTSSLNNALSTNTIGASRSLIAQSGVQLPAYSPIPNVYNPNNTPSFNSSSSDPLTQYDASLLK